MGPRVEQLPPLKLYREDLDKLLSLFKQHCQNLTFGDDEHTYESLDEMESQMPTSASCFLVQGFMPHAEIAIRGHRSARLSVQRSTLFVMERNPKSDLLFLSVKDFLLTRKWYSRIVLRIAAIAIGAVLVAVCFFSKAVFHTPATGELGYDLAFLASFGILMVGVAMGTKQSSYISLRLRAKSQSFWERNGNAIMMLLIGAAVGVIGSQLTKWLEHFWKR